MDSVCSVMVIPPHNADVLITFPKDGFVGASEQGATQTRGRWLTIPRTLIFVRHGDELLLMKRAAHKRIFPNRYNGLGGHIERDEDPYSAARREVQEESGLLLTDLRLRALHHIDADSDTGILLFVFTATSPVRTITDACEEGDLHWVPADRVLDLDLVEDLPLILPRILAMGPDDAPLSVHVSYDQSDQIQIRIVD